MTNPSTGSWVEQWLSAPRFNRYLTESAGDRAKALALYEWNLRLGYALLRDIAHFEVGIRNMFDQAICARWAWSNHWLFDPMSPVLTPLIRSSHARRVDINRRNREAVAHAVAAAGGPSATSGAVIAELPLGFWRHLVDTGHDKPVWVPYLQAAWPGGTSRARVYQVLTTANAARNRIAHHEPVFGTTKGPNVAQVQADIVSLLQLARPDLAAHLRATSTVADMLTQRP